MLITNEEAKMETPSGAIAPKHDPDGPPPYESLPVPVEPVPSASTSTIFPAVPTDLQPNNLLVITRLSESNRGRYLIDTSLEIPASLLPEIEAPKAKSKSKDKEEEKLGAGERPNLRLGNTNGSIAADIWIVDRRRDGDINAPGGREPKRAFIRVKNINGSVKLQVAADPTKTPFALRASTMNGSVTLYIPRTFVGPLTIRKGNGSVRLSPALEARLHTFADIKGKRTCFVGDLRQAGYGQDDAKWRGSAIEVGSANGSIRVAYVDDETRGEGEMSVLAPFVSLPGFLNKLFGGR